ncbi:cytochrome c3 family protein [Desulfothermus sp.]
MKKVFLLAVAGALLFSLTGSDLIEAMKIPKTVLMNASLGKTKNPVYAPVNFPHQKHLRLGCPVCHHKWIDKKNPPKKCVDSGCHDILGAKGAQMRAKNSAYNAYHNPTSNHSCMGCHKNKKKQNLATGPIACKKCHVK